MRPGPVEEFYCLVGSPLRSTVLLHSEWSVERLLCDDGAALVTSRRTAGGYGLDYRMSHTG